MTTKRSTPKKPAAKKVTAKKVTAKKPAAKKPAAKKGVAKKGVAKKKPAAPSKVQFSPLGQVPEVTLREAGEPLSLVFEAPPSQTPQGVALEGHSQFVQAIAFSPDGKTLVTGSEDATMRVWDVASRQCLRTLRDHARAVNCVCFTRDGARLISGSDDGNLKVWSTSSWEVERTLGPSSGYISEVHLAGENRVVSSGSDTYLRLWDFTTGECVHEMPHGSWVNVLDASPDGRFAVASSTDNVIRVWDLTTGAVARTLLDASALNVGTVMGLIMAAENRSGVGHSSFARHAAFAPDGATFFTSSKELIAWDLSTGTERFRVEGTGWEMSGFALVPGRNEVVAASHGSVQLYDLDTKRLLAEAPWDHGGDTHMVAVSPDGRLLACGSQDGPVGLFDLEALRAAGTSPRHISVVHADAVSPDGAYALTGGSDRTARHWNLSTGESRAYVFSDGLFVTPVRFTRDGRFALAMNDKATLAVLDAKSGALVRTMRFPDPDRYRPFSQVRELRDGRLLVGSASGPLTLWNLDGQSEAPESFSHDAGQVVALDVDYDEQVAITSGYTTNLCDVCAWNLSDRSLRWRVQLPIKGYGSGVKIVESRVVVTTSEGGLLVLVLHDGTLLRALDVSPGEYLMSVAVMGPQEVVTLGHSPARVDIESGSVIERFTSVTEHYYTAIDGERRALRTTKDSIAEVDFVAKTITPSLALGSVTNVTPTTDSLFVSCGPMTPERTGTVTVLRRASRDEFRIASPKLPHYEAPRESKTAERKRLAAERAAAKKKAAEKTAKALAKAKLAKKKAAAKALAKNKAAKKKPSRRRVKYAPVAWNASDPSFEKGVTYRFGRWSLVASQPHNHDVVLWTEGAATAIELVSGSNGWWHLREANKEYVVWPHGGADAQDFFARSWNDNSRAEERVIEAGARFEIWDGSYGTKLVFEESELRVTFHDGRGLTVPRDSTDLAYDGRVGEQITSRPD